MQFDTRAIHDGQPPDPSTGAVTVPIYQTSTYVQEAVGQLKDGYDYSRTANPTRRALETCLASLESAEHGFAFASGMAATTTVMHLLSPGDQVVSVNDVYGGTYRLFSKVYEPRGVRFAYLSADQCNTELERHLEGAKMLWLESPTNPLLNVVDIASAAAAAHAAGALLVVDNTFASPYLQRPIELGADIVVHSATKYLGGHSDLVSGLRGHVRCRAGPAAGVPPELAGRRGRAVRLLAGAARAEDAARADAPALRERACGGRIPGRPPGRHRGCSTPASRITRATRSPRARCATTAA